jgi:23S rRNA (adenine1618-N6)-methyltransferase
LLDLRWTWDHDASVGIGEARENVWKRAYRREHDKKKKSGAVVEKADTDMAGGEAVEKKVALAFRISINQDEKEVVLEWLGGSDQVLWESFCGMLHRYFKG